MEDLVSGQWKAKSFGTGLGSWNSLGLTHGSKYTISWLQWVDNLSKNAKAGLYTKNTVPAVMDSTMVKLIVRQRTILN